MSSCDAESDGSIPQLETAFGVGPLCKHHQVC